jgi:phosphoglycerate dehydrogenase-like enzyme
MVRTGKWGMKPLQPVLKSQGQTVGIVGLGRIGRRMAHKLSAFGVELLLPIRMSTRMSIWAGSRVGRSS